MNKGGMGGVIGIFILLIVIITALAFFESPEEYEYTPLNWSNLSASSHFQEPQDNVIVDVVFKGVDAAGYVIFKITNAATKWSMEHPEINWKLLLWIFILAIILYIAIPILKILLIAGIFIKDFFQGRVERKEIKRLKNEKEKQKR